MNLTNNREKGRACYTCLHEAGLPERAGEAVEDPPVAPAVVRPDALLHLFMGGLIGRVRG